MIQLHAGEAYLIYGKAGAGKTTLAYQLAAQSGMPTVYIPTEKYHGTLSQWQTVFHMEPKVIDLVGDNPIVSPEHILINIFALFGDEVRLNLVDATRTVETGEIDPKTKKPIKKEYPIKLRSFNVWAYGKPSVMHDLWNEGYRIFILDSITEAAKPAFEFGPDLTANLSPRDSCVARLMFYAHRIAMNGGIFIIMDKLSKAPTVQFDKPKPWGPEELWRTASYWIELNQSQAKDHMDVHECIFTRNVSASPHSETHWLRLTDKGFVDMSAEEVTAITVRRK